METVDGLARECGVPPRSPAAIARNSKLNDHTDDLCKVLAQQRVEGLVPFSTTYFATQDCRKEACGARKMGRAHNLETAVLLIPPQANHGLLLRCTFWGCPPQFRYCAVCTMPVSQKNFVRRHGHGLLPDDHVFDDQKESTLGVVIDERGEPLWKREGATTATTTARNRAKLAARIRKEKTEAFRTEEPVEEEPIPAEEDVVVEMQDAVVFEETATSWNQGPKEAEDASSAAAYDDDDDEEISVPDDASFDPDMEGIFDDEDNLSFADLSTARLWKNRKRKVAPNGVEDEQRPSQRERLSKQAEEDNHASNRVIDKMDFSQRAFGGNSRVGEMPRWIQHLRSNAESSASSSSSWSWRESVRRPTWFGASPSTNSKTLHNNHSFLNVFGTQTPAALAANVRVFGNKEHPPQPSIMT